MTSKPIFQRNSNEEPVIFALQIIFFSSREHFQRSQCFTAPEMMKQWLQPPPHHT